MHTFLRRVGLAPDGRETLGPRLLLLTAFVVFALGVPPVVSREGGDGTEPMADEWIMATPSASPARRDGHGMAYDSRSSRSIMYGGRIDFPLILSNETWAYDAGADAWSTRRPPQSPGHLTGHAMAYDAESDRTILFGGLDESRTGLDRTWAYDYANDAWVSLNPPIRPAGRAWHAMAYDAQSDVVVMFGGWPLGPPEFDDTWAYSFNSNMWTNMGPAVHPSGRMGHAMAYDSSADRIILFGGGINPYSNETWTYDYDQNTWTEMNPPIRPSARVHHAMAYSSDSDRVVLFGGNAIDGGPRDDTWAYDLGADSWTNLAPAVHPNADWEHRMVYDSRRSCLVLFTARNSETWWYPRCTGPTRSQVDAINPYWYSSPLTVTAWAPDSEVASVTLWFRFSSDGNLWGPWTAFGSLSLRPLSWSFPFPDGEGYYEFYTVAADASGNEEAPPPSADAAAGYDPTPPTSTVLPISPYWYDSPPIQIEASAIDPLSGVAAVTLRYSHSVDNTTWSPWLESGTLFAPPYSWSFPFPDGKGNYRFHALARDVVGNVEPSKTGAEAVAGNRLLPDYALANPSPASPITVGLALPVTLGIDVTNLGGVANATANVGLSNTTTPGSPFATFSLAPVAPGGTAGPFAASWTSPPTTGTYTVIADADVGDVLAESDESNNVYTWTVTVVAGPVTTLVVGQPNVTAPILYVTSATPLLLSVLDQGGTGVRVTRYRVDGGGWIGYAAPLTLPTEGEHVLEWFSEDNAGNAETVRSATVRVDDTPPALALAVGDPKYVATDTYVTSATPLTLAAADGGATPVGLASVEYRIGGPWITWTGPFVLSVDGPHTVEFRATDALGNVAPTGTSTVIVDDAPPVTTPSREAGAYPEGTTFAFPATDAGSGVALTKVRLDGGGWTTYAGPLMLAVGSHTIGFRSVDRLNNTEAERTLSVVIETAPTSTPETNWKPLVAAVFAAILLIVGVSSARLVTRSGTARPRVRRFVLTALPFVVLEAGTGVVSLRTGWFSIPPILGLGTAVDLGILVTGIAVLAYRVRKWTPPK